MKAELWNKEKEEVTLAEPKIQDEEDQWL